MEHVVFFPASDGSAAFRRLPSVEEAVRLVEHLRNIEGVDQVSVHALTEVPLAFRAYYRVEVPGGEAPLAEPVAVVEPAAPAPVELVAVEAAPALEPVEPVEPVEHAEPVPALALVESVPVQGGEVEPVVVASNGQSKDSATSLGFFA